MNSSDEDAYREFKRALETDLRQNVKPVIFALSMLAEDYKNNSDAISRSIDDYIREVPPEMKILGLYLMDSVMKNHKYTTDYNEVFEKRILPLFIYVFENVDEQNRKALFKLRGTWNEVFTNQTLYNIDVRIQGIDHAWPITAQTAQRPVANPTSIQAISNDLLLALSANRNVAGTSHQASSTQIAIANTLSHQGIHMPGNRHLIQEVKPMPKAQPIQKSFNHKLELKKSEPSRKDAPPPETTNPKSSSDSIDSRDPRIRKNKSSHTLQTATVVTPTTTNQPRYTEINLFEPKSVTVSSPPKTKISKQGANGVNGLKRTSPNSLNPNEIKKPKLSSNSQTSPTNSKTSIKGSKLVQISKTQAPAQEVPVKSISKSMSNLKVQKPIIGTTKPVTSTSNKQPSDPLTDTWKLQKSPVLKKVVKPPKTDSTDSTTKPTNGNTKSTIGPKPRIDDPIPSEADVNIKKATSVLTSTGSNNNNSDSPRKVLPSILDFNVKPTVSVPPKSAPANVPKPKPIPASTKSTNPSSINSTKPAATKKILTNNNSNNSETTQASIPKVKTAPGSQNNKPSSQLPQSDLSQMTFNDVDERIAPSSNVAVDSKEVEAPLAPVGTTFSTSELSELSSLINESQSGDKGSAVDFLGKLLHAIKPAEQTKESVDVAEPKQPIDMLLQNSKNSLNELQKQLLSKQNAEANGGKKESGNTQQLLTMIGTILEMTQQKLFTEQTQPTIAQKISLEALMASTSAPPSGLFNESHMKPNQNNGHPSHQNHPEPDPIERHEHHEQHHDQQQQQQLQQQHQQQQQHQLNQQPQQQNANDYSDVTYDLPPIKPRDKTENQNDSLLIIDGRSYTIQPEVIRLIKVYYHDHELFCDTRTKDVFIDKKRVYRMGENTKEVILNGRKVRLMYMGKRIELWIDGISFHFRADSPPKLISITSSKSNQIKRYYVTIDSRTMDMYFNNYKVCQIKPTLNTQGPQNQSNTLMCKLAPEDYELHEISFVCPPKRIQIDGFPRTMRYDLAVPCIEMSENEFHVIRFSGPPREIYIDDIPYVCPFDKQIRIKLNGRAHELAWGGPGFEVIIDGRPYELQFNQPPREIIIGTRPHSIYICGDAPDVKICGRLPYEYQQPMHNDNAEDQKTNEPQQQRILPSLMKFEVPPPVGSTKLPQPPQILNQDTKPGPMDLTNLLKQLQNKGLINLEPKPAGVQLPSNLTDIISGGKKPTPTSTTATETTEVKQPEKIPDLTSFDTDLLKQKYSGAIQSLYSGVQCATCGNRFNQMDTSSVSAGGSRYSKHLDWHFRQNKKEKDEVNKAHSRAWYYILMEWIQYEELSEDAVLNSEPEQIMPPPTTSVAGQEAETVRKAKKHPLLDGEYSDENTDQDELEDENQLLDDLSMCHGRLNNQTSMSFPAGATCPASDDIDDKCCICKDFFEIFFFQEKEEWHFKDAVRVENKVYHPICFEDAREDNSVNNTPATLPPQPSSNQNPQLNNSMNGSIMEDVSKSTSTTVTVKNEPSTQQTESTNLLDSIGNLDDTANDLEEPADTTVEMNSILSEPENNELDSSLPRLVSSCYDDNFKDEPQTP